MVCEAVGCLKKCASKHDCGGTPPALAHFISVFHFKAAVSGTGKAQPCMMLPPVRDRTGRFAFSLAALAHFISVFHFKAAVSGTGKAQPCMILTPPPHAAGRAFRLLLYVNKAFSSVSLSVPFSLSLLIQGWRSAFFHCVYSTKVGTEKHTAGADLYGLRGGGLLKKIVRQNTTAEALRYGLRSGELSEKDAAL